MRDKLGINKLAFTEICVRSCAPDSDNTRKTRHCCSVIPDTFSISRIGPITFSRDRINAIGKDRRVDGSLLTKSSFFVFIFWSTIHYFFNLDYWLYITNSWNYVLVNMVSKIYSIAINLFSALSTWESEAKHVPTWKKSRKTRRLYRILQKKWNTASYSWSERWGRTSKV